MFHNIINAAVKNKIAQRKKNAPKIIGEKKLCSCNLNKPAMIDKSTDTKDLERLAKDKKILKKFKKSVEKKKTQSQLFSEVIGSPRNSEEVEDE